MTSINSHLENEGRTKGNVLVVDDKAGTGRSGDLQGAGHGRDRSHHREGEHDQKGFEKLPEHGSPADRLVPMYGLQQQV